MFNRKNAIVGFIVLKLAKRGARGRVPGFSQKKENTWLRWVLLGGAGVLLGAFVGGLFWRRRRSPEIDLVEFEVSETALEGVLPPDVPLANEAGDDGDAAQVASPETAETPAE